MSKYILYKAEAVAGFRFALGGTKGKVLQNIYVESIL